MTFCQGGDLQREIATYGPLSEENAAILMFELLSSLNYVHGQKVSPESSADFICCIIFNGWVLYIGRPQRPQARKCKCRNINMRTALCRSSIRSPDFPLYLLFQILLETGKEYTRMKLADFGLARPFQDGTEMTESCGTPSYMAPEVYKHKYDSKCDIWSAGGKKLHWSRLFRPV